MGTLIKYAKNYYFGLDVEPQRFARRFYGERHDGWKALKECSFTDSDIQRSVGIFSGTASKFILCSMI